MERNAENTTQRDWHDLKPGDTIWFANGWFEIFDAYAVGRDIAKVTSPHRLSTPPPGEVLFGFSIAAFTGRSFSSLDGPPRRGCLSILIRFGHGLGDCLTSAVDVDGWNRPSCGP
jgi:hypothetical protein